MEQPQHTRNKKSGFDTYVKYSALGIQMAAIVAVFVLAGLGLDEWLGLAKHIFTAVLSVLGCFGAVLYAVKDFIIKKK